MELSLHNVRCFSEAVFHFPESGSLLIRGASGSGKSTILAALHFVSGGVAQANLQRRGPLGPLCPSWVELKLDLAGGPATVRRGISPAAVSVATYDGRYLEGPAAEGFLSRTLAGQFGDLCFVEQGLAGSFVTATPASKRDAVERIAFCDVPVGKLRTATRDAEAAAKATAIAANAHFDALAAMEASGIAPKNPDDGGKVVPWPGLAELEAMDTPQFEGARIAHTLADGNATALARAEYADAKARLLRRRRAVEANAETRVVYAVASSDHASSSKRHQEATAHATEAAGALSDCLSTHMLWEAAGLASGAVGRYASTDAAPLTIAASSVAALLRRHEMVQTTYSAASQAERALADRLGDMASFPHTEGNASTGVGDAAHLQLAVAALVGEMSGLSARLARARARAQLEEMLAGLPCAAAAKEQMQGLRAERELIASTILEALMPCPACGVLLELTAPAVLSVASPSSAHARPHGCSEPGRLGAIDVLLERLAEERSERAYVEEQLRLLLEADGASGAEVESVQRLEHLVAASEASLTSARQTATLHSERCRVLAAHAARREVLVRQHAAASLAVTEARKEAARLPEIWKAATASMSVAAVATVLEAAVARAEAAAIVVALEASRVGGDLDRLRSLDLAIGQCTAERLAERLRIAELAEAAAAGKAIACEAAEALRREAFGYAERRRAFTQWQSGLADAKARSEAAANDLCGATRFAKCLLECEHDVIADVVEALNDHLEGFVDAMFQEHPMRATLHTRRALKSAKRDSSGQQPERQEVNLQILRDGVAFEARMLSGGELARLAACIAAAMNMLSSARVLFFDEVTASLDAEATRELVECIKAQFPSRLVAFVAHQVVAGQFDASLDVVS